MVRNIACISILKAARCSFRMGTQNIEPKKAYMVNWYTRENPANGSSKALIPEGSQFHSKTIAIRELDSVFTNKTTTTAYPNWF